MDIEQPIYTVLPSTEGHDRDSNVRFVGSVPYYVGTECPFIGWPMAHLLKPVNESAKRIAAYLDKHGHGSFISPSPFNEKFGEIVLPAVLPRLDPRPGDAPWTTRARPIPPERSVATMPRYTSRMIEHFGGRQFRGEGGNIQVPAGKPFVYLGWPEVSFESANDAGRAVKSYYEANGRHNDLLSSPWCEYRRGLFLPELHPAMPLNPENASAPPVMPVHTPKKRVPFGSGKATMVL